MSRSRFVLPDSLSPKTRRNGSDSKSMNTGSRSVSSMPIAIPRSGNSPPLGSWSEWSSRGSSRTPGAACPAQFVFTASTKAAVASDRSPDSCEPSIRGSAPRKCSFSGTWPRPGIPVGTFAATLRSNSESMVSPSRSSSRLSIWSLRAARTSMYRAAVITTWMP